MHVINDIGAKIVHSKIVVHFKKKYPLAFHFFTKRLSLNTFYGLPLTILLFSIGSNLFLLFDFTEEVINSREFIVIDNFIAELFFYIRSEPFAKFFYYISQLCNISTVIIIGAIECIYFLARKKIHFAVGILISIFGSGLSIYFGKNIFKINRPHQYAYYHEEYFSFPSGHSTLAVAFYGLIFYFLTRNKTTVKAWSQLISIAFIFWFLIGFSRLYLCVHYLSDVVAGYMLGLLWLLLSISIIEWQEHKYNYAKTTHSIQ